MNLLHHWLCQSRNWRKVVQKRVPWALEDVALGGDVLEIGPGFGLTTELIEPLAGTLTCVEIDSGLARTLRQRVLGKKIVVLCENATSLSFGDASFDAVVCFTMLHHVPSPSLQDQLLTEAARVLRPGGVFAGTDSLDGRYFRLLHVFDTMVVVDPRTFPQRLRSVGFVNVNVDVDGSAFRFRARKPLLDPNSSEASEQSKGLQRPA
jgi:SAM-dependent methyltransferase